MKKKSEEPPPTVMHDATITGLMLAQKNVEVHPIKAGSKILFEVSGNVQAALDAIYANKPCGLRDCLESIKSCRSMIFNQRGMSHE